MENSKNNLIKEEYRLKDVLVLKSTNKIYFAGICEGHKEIVNLITKKTYAFTFTFNFNTFETHYYSEDLPKNCTIIPLVKSVSMNFNTIFGTNEIYNEFNDLLETLFEGYEGIIRYYIGEKFVPTKDLITLNKKLNKILEKINQNENIDNNALEQ